MKKRNFKSLIRLRVIPRLIIPMAISIAIIIITIANPFSDSLFPPSVKDISSISGMYDDDVRYIKFTADKLYYTGLDYSTGKDVKANIYYATIDDICYFFIMPDTGSDAGLASILTNTVVTARLVRDDITYRHIISNMAEQLNFTIDGMKDLSCPVLISQYDYSRDFTRFIIISIYAVSVIAAIFALIEIFVLIRPDFSLSVMRLRHYGRRSLLFEKACSEYERAVATGRKNVFITESFLISVTKSDVDIVPLENIVWIYNYNEIHHMKEFTRLFHPLCIVTDKKKVFKIRNLSKKASDNIINRILTKFPEILVGYKSGR